MTALLLPGPLSAHMVLHLALMNGLAPLLALGARRRLPGALARAWPWATALQLALLWGWHAPGVLDRAMASAPLHLAMQASLFAAALLFWASLAAQPPEGRWRAVAALLVTGKLFCLLGALLALAPRLLYGGGHAMHGMATLADQQVAGLVMIVACPLSYVLAGAVVTARWILALERAGRGTHAALAPR